MKKYSATELMSFLEKREREHRDAVAALYADSRGDEASFEMIRANVFGIFKAVLETGSKKYGEGGAAEAFFAAKLRGISSSWRENLAKAGEKGDSKAAVVEKLKLESVAEIEGWLRK